MSDGRGSVETHRSSLPRLSLIPHNLNHQSQCHFTLSQPSLTNLHTTSTITHMPPQYLNHHSQTSTLPQPSLTDYLSQPQLHTSPVISHLLSSTLPQLSLTSRVSTLAQPSLTRVSILPRPSLTRVSTPPQPSLTRTSSHSTQPSHTPPQP